MLVRKYVDKNGLGAMLAAKRSAGVTPQVNLGECTSRMSLQNVNMAHSGFKPRGDFTNSPKQVSVAPEKGHVSKILKKTSHISLQRGSRHMS